MTSRTAAPSPGPLSLREEALLEVLPFEYFIDDLYDLLTYISLAKLCDAESSVKDDCCVNTTTGQVTLQADLPDLSLGPGILGREPRATLLTEAWLGLPCRHGMLMRQQTP